MLLCEGMWGGVIRIAFLLVSSLILQVMIGKALSVIIVHLCVFYSYSVASQTTKYKYKVKRISMALNFCAVRVANIYKL